MRGFGVAAPGVARLRPQRWRLSDLRLGRSRGARGLWRASPPDVLHKLDAVILQDALRTADRVALAVEQVPNAAQQIDIVRPVVAPAAAALERLDLLKPGFPEPQHMLRQVEFV